KAGAAEAVGQNDLAALEGGTDDLPDVLRAAGRVEQELRFRSDIELRVEHHRAHRVTHRRAARLPGGQHVVTLRPHRLREELELEGLPRPVDPLEGDEGASAAHGSSLTLMNGRVLPGSMVVGRIPSQASAVTRATSWGLSLRASPLARMALASASPASLVA